MRLVLLALLLSSVVAVEQANANTGSPAPKLDKVESLKRALAKKEAEYDAFLESLEALQGRVTGTEKAIGEARKKNKELAIKRKEALIEMNRQYELVVDNPEQDIAPAQNSYRQSVIALAKNKDEIKQGQSRFQELKSELEAANVKRFTLANSRESLVEHIKIERARRLRHEFEKKEQLVVGSTVECNIQETLQKCISRSNLLAKQKASKKFIDALFAGATESSLITRHKKGADARVTILKHEVLDGQFRGQGSYQTKIAVTLKGELPASQSCVLLNISNRYCIATEVAKMVKTNLTPELPTKASDKTAMYEVTIRSDQFDDDVFIDGVNYGSTKLQVMLAAGPHDLVISKQGFEDYRQRVLVERNMLIKANLNRSPINLTTGEKIRDILGEDLYGPMLVGIPAGKFQMGELAGAGIGNEKPAKGAQILNEFAIGQAPITVREFKTFVDATKYVTEAERSNGCAAYIEGKPQFSSTLNWRNPGFKQDENHPVVCVSEKDSKAYLNWLSSVTERKYRLPKEIEWEYVARAGSTAPYWWGEDVGIAKANCAFCGSKWSNLSTAPVKSFGANRFGLYDTVGNVWELTQGEESVARGGSWNFAPKLAKASVRLELSSGFRANYLGFRALREN